MNQERRKELREQYDKRHPDMGVVCWRCGDSRWAMISRDARADFNSTSFQLKLGTWPNREMQRAYNEPPDAFEWSLAKALDYKDPTEDYSDDLEILWLEFLEEQPGAKPMRPGRRK